jgi:hypothetical protein
VDPPLRQASLAELASTVPPPRRAAHAPVAVEERSGSQVVATRAALVPPKRSWLVMLSIVPTTLAAALLGVCLGNGSLEHVVARLLESTSTGRHAAAPLRSATSAPVRNITRSTSLEPAPRVEPGAPPVVRLEDLPLAHQDVSEGQGKRVVRGLKRLRPKVVAFER